MTEKRFRVQEHCLRSSYGIEAENWLVTNDNHSVVLNDKVEAHMVANMSNDVIDKLNHLHEENEKLKLHLHILEEVVYMLDQEVVRAMEDGFESSDWYQNYLAKGTDDLE